MEATQRKCFVLRQHYEEFEIRTELYNEIKLGRFRQGWGLRNLNLRQDKEDWIRNWINEAKKEWPNDLITPKKAEERYWILLPMLDIKQGDFIIVPKQPNNETFILAQGRELNGKVYYFDDEDENKRGLFKKDFRHIINILPESVKEFPYEANIATLLIKKKIRGYQKAVNNVWDIELKEAIDNLWESPEVKPLPLLDAMTDAISDIYSRVLEKLRKLPPGKLEELIDQLFKNAGLELRGSHAYDKAGGDIDRIFELPMQLPPLLEIISSDVEIAPIKLNIQIKQKKGIDFNDKAGIEQLTKMSSEETINEYSVLISTADDFTKECKELAKKYRVILINGIKLAEMYVKFGSISTKMS